VATSLLSPARFVLPFANLSKPAKHNCGPGEVIGVDIDQSACSFSDAERGSPNFIRLLDSGDRGTTVTLGTTSSKTRAGVRVSLTPGRSETKSCSVRTARPKTDPSRHRDLLTFVLVGQVPRAVEMASAIALLVRSTLKSEFRRIIGVCTNCPRSIWRRECLGLFRDLSGPPKKKLEELGVEVASGTAVRSDRCRRHHGSGGAHFEQTVIWTAGVGALAGRQMAERGDRPRWACTRPARSHSFPASRDLCGWRYRIARSKRQAPARCCAGGDPARRYAGKTDSRSRHRPGHIRAHLAISTKGTWPWWQGFCCAAKRQVPCEPGSWHGSRGRPCTCSPATSSLRLRSSCNGFGRI